ncbi:hypothetical protein [Streptococcus sp. oral taxon 431]|jgi:hypothetical protein|uniref:hypothetical protein n=1 Tax=Streptococcus sp. oral taxon 431 TaxID=712633 RepID=UPI002000CB6A|nr:hypothetical protein [Streptococcus sp. oral taxon 431]
MQILTYQDCLNEIGVISFEEARMIYDSLINSSNIHDPEFQVYWKELVEYSAQYAEMRGKWLTLTIEEQNSLDPSRSIIHDRIIHNLQAIRGLAQIEGKDVSWFDKFYDDRKRMGDFANYINYIYAVSSRL